METTSDAGGGRPVGRQLWRDLLFLHQPIPVEALRPHVPASLDIDTFDGQAWVTLIPFAIFDSRTSHAPRALGMDFLETNLRTYVRAPGGEQGIYFFSLEASSWLAVAGARLAYALPYFPAAMQKHMDADGATIRYRSSRVASRLVGGDRPGLDLVWRVGPPVGTAAPGSLDHFLVERYVLFAARRGRLYRARVHHRPYPLCQASVDSLRESLLAWAGLPPLLATPPLIHFSPGVDVDIFWRHRIQCG